MIREITCKFIRNSQSHFKGFTCYSLGDKSSPVFISKADLPLKIMEINTGDYVETADDMLVPVISVWHGFIRVASLKDGCYAKWAIKKGAPVYFLPPEIKYSGWGQRGSGKLTLRQRNFCQQMVMNDFDLVTALRAAGYQFTSAVAEKNYAQKLVTFPKIKEGIQKALRDHLLASGLAESEFALLPRKRLIEDLQEVLNMLHSRVIAKQETDSEYLKVYLKVASELSKNINDIGFWMGYGNE